MSSLIMVLSLLAAEPANLLRNGGFEAGLERWSGSHDWYAQPAGAGTSAVTIADGEGRGGGRALRLDGGGKRGLAMQVLPAYPGRYRIRGWVRCQGLGPVAGGVLAEWLTGDGTWLSGERVINVQGDADWTPFDRIVTAPPRTRRVHLDLLTDAPNQGQIWFDEVSMSRLPSELPPPPAPTIAAATPDRAEGCLEVTWDPATLEGAVLLMIFTDPADELPAAVADPADGKVTLRSLENGRAYTLQATASDGDGRASARGPAATATVRDRQPPRPGWFRAIRQGGRLLAGWKPHVLDFDVTQVTIVAPDRDAPLAIIDVATRAGGTHLIQPVTSDAARLGAFCRDAAGNRGETVWADVETPLAEPRPGPWSLWLTPPTTQLATDAEPPAERPTRFELLALRGQTVGCQLMVWPGAPLRGVWVVPGRVDGLQGDYRFVDTVHLALNSRATPPDELIWPAPADYPDELADEPLRDLPAGRLQPIFLRVAVPRDAAPGRYEVPFDLVAAEGRETVTVVVDVAPVTLPEQTRLTFNYWYDPAEPCRAFGVEAESEDGWRALARQAEMMRDYHQNSVIVSYGLIDAWQRADGSLAGDFRRFDRYVDTFRAAGVDQLFCLTHFGSRTHGQWDDATFSPHGFTARRLSDGAPVEIVALDLLPLIQDHLEARGLLEQFAVHVADEPIAVNRASWLELSAELHRRAPKLRRIDAIHIPDLVGGLEIFVPQLNYLVQWQPEYLAAQAGGVELWTYVAWVPQGKYPNRMIDNAAIKPRVLHWMHYLYGSTGYLHWALNRWSYDLLGSLQSPGDTTITWPSQRAIADSSLRYEAERAGIEDLELMVLAQEALERRGASQAAAREQVLAVVREAVQGAESFTRDWAALEAVRWRLIALIAP